MSGAYLYVVLLYAVLCYWSSEQQIREAVREGDLRLEIKILILVLFFFFLIVAYPVHFPYCLWRRYGKRTQ